MHPIASKAQGAGRVSTLMVAAWLAGCAPAPSAAPPAPSPFKPSASFQDIMASVVDPAADGLWDAVSTVTTRAGDEEHLPHGDEEWAALRQHAIRLVEAGNLLLIEGRPIVAPGRKVEDAHIPGVNTAEDIRQAIAADRPRFTAAVDRLHAAGVAALEAVDAQDAKRLLAAGDAIDKACEGCHAVYWYPNVQKPPAVAVAATAQASAAHP